MHSKILAFAIAAALLLSGCAHAQAISNIGDLVLTPPAGFSGPAQEFPGPGAVTVAFSRDRPEGQVRTLLQITTYEFGEKLAGLPDSERSVAARQYLLQFLKGIERRRSNYKQSEPDAIAIDGIPAARAQWSGLVGSKEAHGVMYAVIVGTKLFIFHTQDAVDAPEIDMQDAIHSIESARFSRNG